MGGLHISGCLGFRGLFGDQWAFGGLGLELGGREHTFEGLGLRDLGCSTCWGL